MPPVTSAEAKRATAPKTKPNPRPNTRAARIKRNHSGSNPSIPGLAIRRAEKHAARMPRSAMALASIAPSESLGHARWRAAAGPAPRRPRARHRCARGSAPALWWISSGHANATTPKALVVTAEQQRSIAAQAEWPARGGAARRRPVGAIESSCRDRREAVPHLVEGQPFVRCEDLGRSAGRKPASGTPPRAPARRR